MLAVIKDDQQIRRPFVVAMYAGEGKPSVHDFLQDFMDEINLLYLSGPFRMEQMHINSTYMLLFVMLWPGHG